MNKKRFGIFSILIVLMTFVLVACGEEGEGTNQSSDIVIGTGGTAGTYYVIAAAMGSAINENSDLNVVVQPTNGSIENINLVNSGEAQLGMSNSDGVYFAENGTEMYEDSGPLNIKGLMSLYMSAGQIATLEGSGIETYADLKGKHVVLGPPSTTIVEMSKAILRAYGIDPETDITPHYLSFDEGLGKLTDGEVDATFFVAGVPTSAMINATSTNDVVLVDIDDHIIEEISNKYSYYEPYVIEAGTYTGTDKDINTFKIMTEIFINGDVADEVAYEFVKTALENLDSYKDAHAVGEEINPEQAARTSAELHPGAAKYYEEIGVLGSGGN